MAIKEVLIPDIGDAADVDVIDILVKPGDSVQAEDALLTLEGDKATMDIPAPFAGIIKAISVNVGDKVSEGRQVMTIEVEGDAEEAEAEPASAEPTADSKPQIQAVHVPDIGDAEAVDVIDIIVKPGDEVNAEDPLITLEGDKATMDIPAPFAGIIKAIKTTVGAKVSQGDLIVEMETTAVAAPVKQSKPAQTQAASSTQPAAAPAQSASSGQALAKPRAAKDVHAGPAVRRIAREFGVDLTRVPASGRKGRILKEDVQAYVKTQLAKVQSGAGGGIGLNIAPAPKIDFAKFGEIETQPLNKIKRLTA